MVSGSYERVQSRLNVDGSERVKDEGRGKSVERRVTREEDETGFSVQVSASEFFPET